jgi:hypothetical protein
MFKYRLLFKVHETLLTESIFCCNSLVFPYHWIHLQHTTHRAPCDAVEVKPKYTFEDLAARLALPSMTLLALFLG